MVGKRKAYMKNSWELAKEFENLKLGEDEEFYFLGWVYFFVMYTPIPLALEINRKRLSAGTVAP